MSVSVRGTSCGRSWEKAVRFLLEHGAYSPSVRGPTLECLNLTIVVDDPHGLPRLSESSPLFLQHERFSDAILHHPRLTSWYGINQVERVVNLLKDDPITRRAVVGVWDPAKDLD